MKGITGWSYRPYIPADLLTQQKNNPYVCRLVPHEFDFDFEILDSGVPGSAHILKLRIKGTDCPWREIRFDGTTAHVDNLQHYCDYEFYVERENNPSARSALRFVRTGFYPDNVVNYVHPQDDIYAFSGHYLCDPTFVRVPSGALVAAMNLYANSFPQNLEILFRSEDNGKTWKYLCDLFPAYWGTLFMHRNVLYMLAVSTENGHLMIGASYDEGTTWTKPTLLFVGGNTQKSRGFQRQPMPIIVHKGRIMTNVEFGSWQAESRYGIGILSAPEDADLLDSSSWTLSDFTHYDMSWPNSPKGGTIALLEGSLFEAKDGKLINLLRMQIGGSDPSYGKACLLEVNQSDPEAAPKFHSIIDMPTGANSRTHILQDPQGGKYWGIGNLVDDAHPKANRSILALVVSEDGYNWKTAKILLDYSHLNTQEVGFQYTSFIFDGDDILYLVRTSFNQAHNYHDANCQTFGVVKNFRELG